MLTKLLKNMKTVFITGSGRNLGKGLAIKFAEKGWNIALHYNTSKDSAEQTLKLIQSKNVKASLVHFDLKCTKDIQKGFDEIYDYHGNIDVLINNSAVYPNRAKLTNTSIDDWDEVMDTNLRSVFYCSKLFAEKSKDDGRIINIACLSSLEVWRNRIAYNVSKTGVLKLTEVLARELAPNISVNAINPGAIYIEGEASTAIPEVQLERIPMGRFGKIEDIFDAAYFFATCSKYITGQYLNVDGGNHLVK